MIIMIMISLPWLPLSATSMADMRASRSCIALHDMLLHVILYDILLYHYITVCYTI